MAATHHGWNKVIMAEGQWLVMMMEFPVCFGCHVHLNIATIHLNIFKFLNRASAVWCWSWCPCPDVVFPGIKEIDYLEAGLHGWLVLRSKSKYLANAGLLAHDGIKYWCSCFAIAWLMQQQE